MVEQEKAPIGMYDPPDPTIGRGFTRAQAFIGRGPDPHHPAGFVIFPCCFNSNPHFTILIPISSVMMTPFTNTNDSSTQQQQTIPTQRPKSQ